MHKYDREKDRLIIKLEAAEKAYMSLLYDYTELKEQKEIMEKAFKEVRDLLDYLINHNYASKDTEKKEDSDWSSTITGRPHQRPNDWKYRPNNWPYWGWVIWPFIWDNPFDTTDYPTHITLCSVKSWSIEFPCADDTDDVTAEWDDEDDGWENEEVRRESKACCWRRGRKGARSCCSAKWGQRG